MGPFVGRHQGSERVLMWISRTVLVCSHLITFCFGPCAGYDENYTVAKAAGKYSDTLDALGAALRPIEKVRAEHNEGWTG